MDPDTALAALLAETVMLRAAIDSGDRDVVARSLHTLREQADELADWVIKGGALPAATP